MSKELKLKLFDSSWKNLFENIRRDPPEKPTGNFWAALQHLEEQLEDIGKKE